MSYQDHNSATQVTATRVVERREVHDRRCHNWQTLTYCGFEGRGRRRHARRSGFDCYVDRYDPRLVLTGIVVLVMSGLDALFTLVLLDRGAYEANFVMAHLMETSDQLFVAVKMAFTAFGIIFITMHAHFHIWRAISGKRLLQIAATGYGLLITYELILLAVLKGQ